MSGITIVFDDASKIHEVGDTTYIIHKILPTSINLVPGRRNSLGVRPDPPLPVRHILEGFNTSWFNLTRPRSTQLVGCSTRSSTPCSAHPGGVQYVLVQLDTSAVNATRWVFDLTRPRWVRGVRIGFKASMLGSWCPRGVRGVRVGFKASALGSRLSCCVRAMDGKW